MTPATLAPADRGSDVAGARSATAIRIWLICVALLVVAMVMVGGATRLTDSGLSITEWQPIHGAIPPLSDADWQEEFEKYKQIPEYAVVNEGMTLDAFKGIFWWEWAHRFLGRFIGIAFALPLAAFWIAGRIPPGLKPKLVGILALGGLQGAVGWWMVASGLVDRIDVSQYRLAAHLTLACIILAAIVWVAEGLRPARERAPADVKRLAAILVAAVFLQIFLGGLVAGLKAGWTYNTWPLLDGAIVPGGLMVQVPWWANLFENPKTVQFDHRLVAYAVLVLAVVHAVLAARAMPGSAAARRAWIIAGLVVVQAAIGVAALVHMVPLSLGLAHQLGATVVLWAAVAHRRRMG